MYNLEKAQPRCTTRGGNSHRLCFQKNMNFNDRQPPQTSHTGVLVKQCNDFRASWFLIHEGLHVLFIKYQNVQKPQMPAIIDGIRLISGFPPEDT